MGSQLITLLIVNQIESQPELEMIPPSRDSCIIKCSGGASIWNAFTEAGECTQVNKVKIDDACCE